MSIMLSILVAAFLLPAQVASMPCANIATTQTKPVRGRDGVAAVLKVSSEDDHNKNSHDCQAVYQLLTMPGPAGTPLVVELLTSDGDWSRSLFLHLNGFSLNGSRVFGSFSETGKFPSAYLFDYDTTDGKVRLIDLKKRLGHMAAPKCGSSFDVIGTTAAGAIVLELNSTQCPASNGRWLLSPTASNVRRLPQDASFLGLYEFKDGAP